MNINDALPGLPVAVELTAQVRWPIDQPIWKPRVRELLVECFGDSAIQHGVFEWRRGAMRLNGGHHVFDFSGTVVGCEFHYKARYWNPEVDTTKFRGHIKQLILGADAPVLPGAAREDCGGHHLSIRPFPSVMD